MYMYNIVSKLVSSFNFVQLNITCEIKNYLQKLLCIKNVISYSIHMTKNYTNKIIHYI